MHQEALPKRRHLHPNGWNSGEDIYAFLTVMKRYKKRQSYFLIIPYLSHKFCSDFGIRGVVAGTTPVFNSVRRDFIGYIGTSNGGRIPSSLHHSTDELTLHQFGRRLWGTTARFDQVVANKPLWSPTKILQPWRNKFRRWWPP